MQDYGAFCYLDVEKTGSSFITRFLKEASTIEPVLLTGHAHLRAPRNNVERNSIVPGVYRNKTFYFNSVRNPVKYYTSLYNYGCDKRGALYNSLASHGLSDLYDNTKEGFFRWCEFILRPENAHYLHGKYAPLSEAGVGFLTYRFLRLSIPSPLKRLSTVKSISDANSVLDKHNICQFTIRNEQLTEDLEYLTETHLRDMLDPEKARSFLQRDKINSSQSKAAIDEYLYSHPAIKLIMDRDRIIFDRFYQDELKNVS